jgi:hypothetical protein
MRRLPPGVLGITLVLVATLALAPVASASDKYEKNENVKIDPAKKPAPGKALIYFARTQVMGAAIKAKLYAGEEFLSILASKTFVPYECDPGKHVFAVVAENAGLLDAEVVADKIYVVQVAMHMGAMKARVHFEVARKDSEALEEFLDAKGDLEGITTTDDGRAWAKEDAEDDVKKMKKYREKGEVETLKPEDGTDTLP